MAAPEHPPPRLLHHVLTKPLLLERLPWPVVILALIGIAVLPAAPWPGELRGRIVALHAVVAVDALNLMALPRLGRSFGPVRPPLIALAALRAAITLGVGALWAWRATGLVMVVGLQGAITALSVYALWVEPFRLGITHETLASPRLDPALPPVRVLHLADLHVERPTPREQHLQRIVAALKPDIIVFSGDFINLSFNQDAEAAAAVREIVSGWHAPGGVFVVSGSPLVESRADVARFVEGTDARWLRDESVEVEVRGQHLTIIGISCVHSIHDDARRMRETVQRTPADRFRLLVFHSPDIAPQAAEAGVDLYVCGHTHGGQVRLPLYGALVTSSRLGKRFEMGRYKLDHMTLYVSRGIGLEGAAAPRARLLCPPEVVLWTLKGC